MLTTTLIRVPVASSVIRNALLNVRLNQTRTSLYFSCNASLAHQASGNSDQCLRVQHSITRLSPAFGPPNEINVFIWDPYRHPLSAGTFVSELLESDWSCYHSFITWAIISTVANSDFLPGNINENRQDQDREDVLAEPPAVLPLAGVDGHADADGRDDSAVPGRGVRWN